MAATRKKGAVKKAATKKVVKKATPKRKTAPKKQPTPKAKRARARGSREQQANPPVIGAEVDGEESLTDLLGEAAARRILLLQTMFGYEHELEMVRVKGAIIAIETHLAPQFEDFDVVLAEEMPAPTGEAGRPSLYDPSWMLVTVLCLMGAGASKVELVAALGITENTLSQWCGSESGYYKPIFSKTVELGERLSASWWQQCGRQRVGDKGFNTTLWKFNMANRFGWMEKKEVAGDPDKPLRMEHGTAGTDWDEVEAAMNKKKQLT